MKVARKNLVDVFYRPLERAVAQMMGNRTAEHHPIAQVQQTLSLMGERWRYMSGAFEKAAREGVRHTKSSGSTGRAWNPFHSLFPHAPALKLG